MDPQTVGDLYGSFEKFLVILVHSILYTRKVYPDFVFEKVRQYNTALFRCRHPEVNEWINEMVKSAMVLVEQSLVDRIDIVILQEVSRQPLERYALDLRNFPTLDMKNLNQQQQAMRSWGDIQEQYRACIRTLYTESHGYGDLPESITFTVLCETKDFANNDHDSPWIVADSKQLHQDSFKSTYEDPGQRTMRPIRYVDAGLISFNFYMEEEKSQQKRRLY